jgi:hypothetical protein
VSIETIRKWRKRGPGACQDRSGRPHKLAWRASDEERTIKGMLGLPKDRLCIAVRYRCVAADHLAAIDLAGAVGCRS